MMIGRPGSGTNKQKHEDNTGVVETSSEPARRIEVDTERLSPSRLIQHAEGAKWTIPSYFSMRVGSDNASLDFDSMLKDPSQQYREIKRLVIRVTSPLTSSQNTDDKTFTVQGEGFIDHGVIPNTNDVFVADIGDGQQGLMLITTTERLSYRKEASYRVEYTLKQMMTEELEVAIKNKISESVVYSPEHLERTGDSLITEETYTRLIKIKDDIKYLQNAYLGAWTYLPTDGWAIPEQSRPMNDGFMESFLPFVGIERKSEYNYPPFTIGDVPTLWAMLKQPHRHSFRHLVKEMGLVDITPFRAKRSIGNIGYSQYFMTMWASDLNMMGAGNNLTPSQSVLTRENPDHEYDWGELAENQLPYYKKVSLKPYIFSEGFYNETPETEIERLVLLYTRKEAIPADKVVDLYDRLFELEPLEQFYYSPIVLLLMHYVR